MNKKENCQNCSEREQNIVVKRVVNQKSMSQEIVNQSGESSAYAENRNVIKKRLEKKQCNGLQHSDDDEKQKVIDSIMKVSRDNGFDDAYLQQHSDCSASSIKRFHSAWMGKRMSNWTTIFNLAHCVSVNCVFAENLVGILDTIIMFVIRDAGVASFHIDSTKKVVIEIKFSKDKLLRVKDGEDEEKKKRNKDNGTIGR